VQLLQDQHQAVVEDAPVGGGERGGVGAGAQLLQHVVEAGESEVRVLRQDALAVGVEVFGDDTNPLVLFFERLRDNAAGVPMICLRSPSTWRSNRRYGATPCLARFVLAFSGSHSNRIMRCHRGT
jgi:hypothetical protein